MARILLTYVVPFLMPMAVYAAWVWYRGIYAAQHGGEAPRIERGPWPLLLFLGAVCAFGVLGATALIRGGPADQRYVPPQVVDGEVVPGHLVPKNTKP
jgi:hypothetical protein